MPQTQRWACRIHGWLILRPFRCAAFESRELGIRRAANVGQDADCEVLGRASFNLLQSLDLSEGMFKLAQYRGRYGSGTFS